SCTRAILDRDGRPLCPADLIRYQAGQSVDASARWNRNDDLDRSRRLRPCTVAGYADAEDTQCGSAHGQMQECVTEKFHSITSSARASSVGGTSSPNAFAVLRLITSSNFVDCTTGKSAGLVPFTIRPA